LSNDEIAERLTISPFTVKNHVSACISKLGAANRTQAATIAVEYRLIP
jgi:DNA-binding NarL/FixJ family response regulator